MSRKPKTSLKSVGGVQAARDVILGNQYNLTDLARLETLLEQVVELLRQPDGSVTVGSDVSRSILLTSHYNSVSLSPADLGALRTLGLTTDLARREELYLARFILNETYAQWDRYYLPLAGQLLNTSARLYDRNDPNLGAGGLPLDDVRDVIHEHGRERFVILGEPGSGKTTTLHRLALDLARERLRNPASGKLPLSINLANFSMTNQLPADFLRARWETTGLGIPFGEALAAGQVCFFLDGINQMPADDRHRRIDHWRHWAAASDLPPGNLAIFTCRTADYVPRLGLPEVHIQALDNDRIQKYFLLRFGDERGQILWRALCDRLRSSDKHFEDLARNPMLLSLLTDRMAEDEAFTESKGVILQEAASRRIKYELEEGGSQPESLTANPDAAFNAVMEALGLIAFAMQSQGEGTVFDRAKLERLPLTGKGQLHLSLDEVLKMAVDSTLMNEAGTVMSYTFLERNHGKDVLRYEFRHQLFQEYFAARELLRRFRKGESLEKCWAVPWWKYDPRLGSGRPSRGERLHPPPITGWEETVIMAAGLAGKDTSRLIAVVRKDNLPLAGRALAETQPDDHADLADLAVKLRVDLLERQRSSNTHIRARIGAGLALGELGHPELRPQAFEFEGRTVWVIVPPMQPVPAGNFIRGSNPTNKRDFTDQYITERLITLPAFSLSRYPVTNAEYRLFIEDGGYLGNRWWSDAGLNWKKGDQESHNAAIEEWMKHREFLQKQKSLEALLLGWGRTPGNIDYWKEITKLSETEALQHAIQQFSRPFDRPAFWEDLTLNSPSRPVVGVNWHEAEAYCRWFSAVTKRNFRLPAETEWEKAARGADRREYPWGNKFDWRRCNTNESGIDTTTPVGLYPTGASPFGLLDAAGNVWEWTADWYQAYPGSGTSDDFGEKFRIVRGGSRVGSCRDAHCTSRFRFVPESFVSDVGFRILCC